MRGVRKNGNSVMISFSVSGKRHRRSLRMRPTPANLRKARALKDRIDAAIATGTFREGDYFPVHSKDTLAEVLGRWLGLVVKEVEPTTLARYRRVVEGVLIPAMGALSVTSITRDTVREWAAGLSVSRGTLANYCSILRAGLESAVDAGALKLNPMAGYTPRRKEPERVDHVDPFTPGEQAAICLALGPELGRMARFGFWTGLRLSELIALQWDDLDLEAGDLLVCRARVSGYDKGPKTKSGRRRVRLLTPARKALEGLAAGTGEVFKDPATGKRWEDAGQLYYLWQRALSRAGVRYRNAYQMRHTYASMLLSAGENPMWVAQQMGHRDWGMLRLVYGRYMPSISHAGDKAEALASGNR